MSKEIHRRKTRRRKAVFKTESEAISFLVNDDRLERAFVRQIRAGQIDTLQFVRMREDLRREGHPPSRPAICAYSIYRYLQSFPRVVTGVYSPVFVTDFMSGAMFLATGLLSAEDMVRGNWEEDFDKAAKLFSSDLTSQAEAYLRGKDFLESVGHKLKRDPTGFTAVDEAFVELQQGKWRWAFEQATVPQFFMRGANFTKTAYKELYPLTENLPQP